MIKVIQSNLQQINNSHFVSKKMQGYSKNERLDNGISLNKSIFNSRNNPHSKNLSFGSYANREEILRRLELMRESLSRMKNAFVNVGERSESLEESVNPIEIQAKPCKEMAHFMLNFVSETLNNSTHNVREFFASESVAAAIRGKLSPKCQQDSLELRTAIKKTEVLKDPVLTLISANSMKRFIPEEGVLSNKQYRDIVDTTKAAYLDVLGCSDMSAYSDADRISIGRLAEMIKSAKGVDFGAKFEEELKKLISKKSGERSGSEIAEPSMPKLQQRVFIPPVRIKYIVDEH